MNKHFITICLVLIGISAMAQENITLPQPNLKSDVSLYQALKNRQTNREYSSKEISMQELSNLLWCAGGVNREDGRLTSPTARNAQEIDIMVLMEKGMFLYLPKENVLKQIIAEDVRGEMSRQDMVVKAPLTLLFVANYEKMHNFDEAAREFYGATDAGFVSQNVYLYCAAYGLNTVVMGAIDRDFLQSVIPYECKAILAQPVGYPAK